MSILSYVGMGFGAGEPEPAVCDYPIESNVAEGVVYADGAMTGTLDVDLAIADPPFSAGTLIAYDGSLVPEEGVAYYLTMVRGPGSDGYGLDTDVVTLLSDVNGAVVFTKFLRGATYTIKRGCDGQLISFVVPQAAGFLIPETLGNP